MTHTRIPWVRTGAGGALQVAPGSTSGGARPHLLPLVAHSNREYLNGFHIIKRPDDL